MVKRVVLLLLPLMCLASPLQAQDYAGLEIGFGYANWGVDIPSFTGPPTTERSSGFAMHTNLNFTSWFGIDNYLGAYSFPTESLIGENLTAYYNVFGVKLTKREVLGGRISPYVVAGFGGGTVTTRQGFGFSSAAARYGGGADFRLSDGFALRVDASNLAIGNNLVDDSWSSNFNLATSVIFGLGGF